MRRFLQPSTGHDSTLWPVLLLLLIVLVPSTGVVWMMRAAMENERLAVRQRLTEAYHAQLEFANRRIDAQWQQLGAQLDTAVRAPSPAQAFAQLVARGDVQSAVIIDERGGLSYPPTRTIADDADSTADPAWRRAEQLEFAGNSPQAAADAYHEIAAGN